MKKNWLIRTKNNHILGPVSLKKIKELISNESLHEDDEISSGNGYWFFIREKDLVDKYIHKEKPQGFNPISEAVTSIADLSIEKVDEIEVVEEEPLVLTPNFEELEYPSTNEEATKENTFENLSFEEKKDEVELVSKVEDSHNGDFELKDTTTVSEAIIKKSILNQNFLFIIMIVLFIF